MKAMVYKKYGPPEVLHVAQVTKPVPLDNEVLVKVYATSVTAGDTRMRSFTVPPSQRLFARFYLGIRRPKRPVLGMELAGVVEATGRNVSRFQAGDRVFASTFGVNFGGYAEYKCFPENKTIARIPEPVSFEEAAVLPIGGTTALNFLRKAKLKKGDRVLIYGASGSVGSFAVQIASFMRAEVNAACSSSNRYWVESLGAERVFDYVEEEWLKNPFGYDIIFDAVGKAPRDSMQSLLNPDGKYVSVLDSPGRRGNSEDLAFLAEMIVEEQLRPIIDRNYSFEEIPEAHEYVDTGRKKGNVVVSVSG